MAVGGEFHKNLFAKPMETCNFMKIVRNYLRIFNLQKPI